MHKKNTILNKIIFYAIAFVVILSWTSCSNSDNPNDNIKKADAGNDQFIYSPSLIQLNASFNGDISDELSYFWSINSKPKESNAYLTDTHSINPKVQIDIDGEYLISLKITSNKGDSYLDDVKIVLNKICKKSNDIKFVHMKTSNSFHPKIRGKYKQTNTNFISFNPITNAVKYKLSLAINGYPIGDVNTKNRFIIRFGFNENIKHSNIQFTTKDDTLIAVSRFFGLNNHISFKLKAFDKNDNIITTSKEMSFIVGKDYVKEPSKLYFNSINDKNISIGWCHIDNATGYTLRYGNSLDNLNNKIDLKGQSTVSTFVPIINDKKYYFSLAGVNKNGTSIFSDAIVSSLDDANDVNFAISKVTFNQAVQKDMSNDDGIPIIAGKPGVLRVFLKVKSGISHHKVKIALNGTLNGENLEPIIRNTIISNSDFENSDTTNKPIVFHIDNEKWLQEGVSFSITIDPDNKIQETSEDDNRYPLNGVKLFGFKNVSKMRINLVLIDTAYGKVNISPAFIYKLKRYLKSIYPLNDIEISVDGRLYLAEAGKEYANNIVNLLVQLAKYMNVKYDNDPTRGDIYHIGLFKQKELKYEEKYIAGVGFINIKDEIPILASVIVFNGYLNLLNVFAHELAHNHGRYHVSAKDEQSNLCLPIKDIDESYPYNKEKEYANIGKTSYNNNIFSLYKKNRYHDMMSYCLQNVWISDYTYKGLYAFKQRLDRLHPKTINRASSLENNNSSIIVNGQVILGKLSNGIWEITEQYKSKHTINKRAKNTNFYFQIKITNGDLFKIPFSLMKISHSDTKVFKIFVPSEEKIQLIEIFDKNNNSIAILKK